MSRLAVRNTQHVTPTVALPGRISAQHCDTVRANQVHGLPGQECLPGSRGGTLCDNDSMDDSEAANGSEPLN